MKQVTRQPFKGRHVGVIGAGRSGQSAAQLLARYGAQVLLSDSGGASLALPNPAIQIENGGHSDALLQCDLIIRSPGVPNHLPILKAIRRRRIPIYSEIELGSQMIHPKNLVAITGTNGKTTTTSLVGELFAAAFPKRTFVAGNIGTPLCDRVEQIPRGASVVLEVSSYQLEDVQTFHPTVSAILNITPDHLEHHGTMAAYAAAKARIYLNQTRRDVCVLNADDAACRRLAKRCRAQIFWFSRRSSQKQGISFHDGKLSLRWKKLKQEWELDWSLPGAHNVENALAAIGMAVAANVPMAIIRRVIHSFRGVEHRLEWVRTLNGARYVNDSKATNVDSTRVALESFTQPLVLIMGGRGKGSPYAGLKSLIKEHVKHLLLIGEDANRIDQELGAIVQTEKVGDLPTAVRRAAEIAKTGDVVLLSPACASFDQYGNYEERGADFKAQVARL